MTSESDHQSPPPIHQGAQRIWIWALLILVVLVFVDWLWRMPLSIQSLQHSSDHIAVVPIYDHMANGSSSRLILSDVMQQSHVKAVILDINSPGSTVTDAESFVENIKSLQNKGIPVVAAIGNIGASGAYWVASSTDKIYAHRSSMVGSIGVTADLLSVHGLSQKLGVSSVSVSSGPLKGGTIFDPITPDRKAEVQNMVDDLFAYFLGDVVKKRRLTQAVIDDIKKGGIYDGRMAQSMGLVDEIGGLDQATAWLRKGYQEPNLPVVYYQPTMAPSSNQHWLQQLLNSTSSFNGNADQVLEWFDNLPSIRIQAMG